MRTLLIAAAATLTLATSAHAAQTYYVGCESGWTTDAPATALADGGGCFAPTVKPPINGATQWWLFGGEHAGEVKQIELELHAPVSDPLAREISLPVTIDIQVKVGDETVYASDAAGLVGPAQASGSLPGGFKSTFVIPGLDIPASADPQAYSVAVTAHYNDDPFVWGAGASDAASAVTFLTAEDLPEPEPEEEYEG